MKQKGKMYMSKKVSRFLFYIIHSVIAFVAGITIMQLYFKKLVPANNPYIYFTIENAFLLLCIVNLCVMFFTYKLLKFEKYKKYYLPLFINYVIINVCSYLMFYFGVYLVIAIRLSIYGIY